MTDDSSADQVETNLVDHSNINSINDNNFFVFSFQDDDKKLRKFAIPMDQVTQEMRELMNNFTIYGNNIQLQCFSMAGYIEGGKPISWPQWRVNGIELPRDIFDKYVKLKRSIILNSHCVAENNFAENMNIVQSLTIKMYLCFACDFINSNTRNSLVWE